MKTNKKPFSARISGLLGRLIDLEIKQNGGTQADAMERLALKAASHSPEATKLVLEELEKDPKLKSILALATGAASRLGRSPGSTKQK